MQGSVGEEEGRDCTLPSSAVCTSRLDAVAINGREIDRIQVSVFDIKILSHSEKSK